MMSSRVAPSVDLSRYDNSWYHPGRSRVTQALWFFVGAPIVRSSWLPFSIVRRELLRWFGARIGTGVVCKPGLRVKFPWRLTVGDHSWLGEDCWIDNLADVVIGRHCCLSQASYLCTGNHDWSDVRFALRLGEIHLEDGAWVGARATVLGGVTLHPGAVATAGSVVVKSIPAREIHGGSPASFLRVREIKTQQVDRPTEATP